MSETLPPESDDPNYVKIGAMGAMALFGAVFAIAGAKRYIDHRRESRALAELNLSEALPETDTEDTEVDQA